MKIAITTLIISLLIPAVARASFDQDLKFGSTGAGVAELQNFLKQEPKIYPEGIVSGYYGNLTRKAVMRFQEKHGISPASGYFGPLTRAKAFSLNSAKPVAKAPAVVYGRGAASGSYDGVSVKTADASHSCSVFPFAQTLAAKASASYKITLAPSAWDKSYAITTGLLPQGVETVLSSGPNAGEAMLVFTTVEGVKAGSYGISVIYDEFSPGVAHRVYCQLNLEVKI